MEMFDEVKRLCHEEARKYIYAYCEQPDVAMHKYGCYSEEANAWVKEIDYRVEKLSRELNDTLLIVIADHGHINTGYKILSDYPDLIQMLKCPISIESRAACFHVKDEYKKAFPKMFKDIFGDDFVLLSNQEIIEQKLFGDGTLHQRFEDFIGDYLAVAVADKGMVYWHESKQYLSNHAGMTENEIMIPFIAIEMK